MWPAPRFLELPDSRRHGNGQAHRHPNPRQRSALPRLEALEDRIVLSPFLVSSPADSGVGSLRQAILDANNPTTHPGADVINFASTLRAHHPDQRRVEHYGQPDHQRSGGRSPDHQRQ